MSPAESNKLDRVTVVPASGPDRTASVLWDGVQEGFSKRWSETCQSPWKTAGEAATVAAFSYLLSRHCMAAGPATTKLIHAVLGVSFGVDLLNRGAHVAGAVYDSYRNPAHYDDNKRTIAHYAGEGLFDFALFGTASMVGLEAAQLHAPPKILPEHVRSRNQWEKAIRESQNPDAIPILRQKDGKVFVTMEDLPENNPFRQLFLKQKGSVVQIGHPNAQGELQGGSGFVVSEEGLVATNAHVANKQNLSVKMDDGAVYPLRLVSRDVNADLALLKIEVPAGQQRSFTPASLAANDQALPHEIDVAVIGHPYSVEQSIISPCKFSRPSGWKVENDRSPFLDLKPDEGIYSWHDAKHGYTSFYSKNPPVNTPYRRTEKLHLQGATRPGNSGSPVFDMDGNVVGVYSNSDGVSHHATAVEHLRALMNATSQHYPEHGWLRVKTHLDNPSNFRMRSGETPGGIGTASGGGDLSLGSSGAGTAGGAGDLNLGAQPRVATVESVAHFDRPSLLERLNTLAEERPAEMFRPPTWQELALRRLRRVSSAAGIGTYGSHFSAIADDILR